MTVQDYIREFKTLFEKMENEHGTITRMIIADSTKYHKPQMPINSKDRWIDVEISFES